MRSNKAFTFPEVLLSLVVLAVSMTLLLNLQTRSIFRIYKSRDEVDRIFPIKERLLRFFDKTVAKDEDPQKPVVERLEQPEVAITLKTSPINAKSSLKKFKDHLVLISSEGKWKTAKNERSLKMVSFVFKAKEQKHE